MPTIEISQDAIRRVAAAVVAGVTSPLEQRQPLEHPARVDAMGLDLSLTASGVAASDGFVAVIGRDGVTSLPVHDQIEVIEELAGRIQREVTARQPRVVVVEALDNAQSYGGVSERAWLWWEVVHRLHHRGFRIAMPTSAQVKIYAAGNGGATKPQVIAAVKEHWPRFDVGRDNNKADAAAMAAMGAHLLGQPLCELPPTHTRKLAEVRYTTDPPRRVLKKRGQA